MGLLYHLLRNWGTTNCPDTKPYLIVRTKPYLVHAFLISSCFNGMMYYCTISAVSIYFLFSSQSAGFLQRIDSRLREQIKDLVDEGVRGVNEMRRHLRHYVAKVLFKGRPLPPRSNRRFYPTKTDVRNAIYESVVKQRWSKVDQENLQKKIEDWRREGQDDFFFFRPYAQTEFTGGRMNESDEDDDAEEVVEVDGGVEGLLFVHQTKWQRRLLKRYGNELSLLDATYRTTKYALPLFFLVVKTNVDYQVVGSFVLQSEASYEIEKALKVIADWNTDWSPKSFLVDYSEAEIGAVERLFPGNF